MPKPGLRMTLLVIGGALACSLPARGREGSAFSFLLTLWIVGEGVRGRRRWDALGFRLDNLWPEMKRNVLLIGLVGVIVQVGFWLVARFIYPPLLHQVLGRIAAMQTWVPSLAALLIFITFQSLSEEIAFRGFVQGRLAPHWGTPQALLLAALLFGGFHWQARIDTLATISDFLFVVLDGAIYGWIYARSGNLFVTWLAHLLADMVGLAVLL